MSSVLPVPRPYLTVVGSGTLPGALTNEVDCHVYLLDGGDGELALVDAGTGMATDALLDNVRRAGRDPAAIGTLLITHAHGDHAGGAAALRERIDGLRVLAGAEARRRVEAGDEAATSVAVARAAGLYPPDYRLRSCRVDGELREGEPLRIGALTIEPIATPGHSADHVSLLVEHLGARDLLAGDAVFSGGRIALQPTADCDLAAHVATLRRLGDLRPDGLFAGHGDLVLADAAAHIAHANDQLDRLLIPPALFETAPLG